MASVILLQQDHDATRTHARRRFDNASDDHERGIAVMLCGWW